MVDRDKVRKRSGSSSGKSDKKRRKKKKKGGGKGKGSGSGSTSGGGSSSSGSGSGDEMLYDEKMEHLKGKGGSSGEGGGSGGSVNPNYVGNVLEAMANILFYSEGKMRSYKEASSKRETVEINATTNVYSQFTDIIARNNVQNICEKYNIDWEKDVLQQVIAEQDFSGGAESAMDPSDHVVDLSGSRDFEREDFHKLLLALGQLLMYSKTAEEFLDPDESPEEKMAQKAIKDVSAKCIDFIGTFNIQSVAKKNGISWKSDVMDRIGEGNV